MRPSCESRHGAMKAPSGEAAALAADLNAIGYSGLPITNASTDAPITAEKGSSVLQCYCG